MKELSKPIMNRSRFKNRYLKWLSCESEKQFFKKMKKTYIEKATENGIIGSKKFWSTVKPFISPKGFN